jgi:hypothetical protein
MNNYNVKVSTAVIVEVSRPTFQKSFTCSVTALMMEAVRTSETSVYFTLTTRHYIPEDS